MSRPAKHSRNVAIVQAVAGDDRRGAISRAARAESLSPQRIRQIVNRAGVRSEKAIQADIVKNMRAIGWFVSTFSQAQRAQMTAGVPDVIAMHERFGTFWIEVKRPQRRNEKGGGCSTEQLQWHAHARRCGTTVIVAYEWADVQAELARRGMDLR